MFEHIRNFAPDKLTGISLLELPFFKDKGIAHFEISIILPDLKVLMPKTLSLEILWQNLKFMDGQADTSEIGSSLGSDFT